MNSKKEGKQDKENIKTLRAKLKVQVELAKKGIIGGALSEAHDELYKFITEEKDNMGGDDSVFIIPGLLTLAEIHIIEGRIKKAEQYLNAAHWSFLKNNDRALAQKKKEKGQLLTQEEQLDYKITLHRTFAKLYELKSDFKEAINELKTSIYLESTRWGPQHPFVAYSYFLMGKIFVDMGNHSIGESFFSKVSEIWYRFFKNYIQKSSEEQETESEFLGEYTFQEAFNYLIFIQKHFEDNYDETQSSLVFTPVMRLFYSIGQMHKIAQDEENYIAYLRQVLRQCTKHLPEGDRKIGNIRSQLLKMNVNVEQMPQPLRLGREDKEEGQSLIQMGDD